MYNYRYDLVKLVNLGVKITVVNVFHMNGFVMGRTNVRTIVTKMSQCVKYELFFLIFVRFKYKKK